MRKFAAKGHFGAVSTPKPPTVSPLDRYINTNSVGTIVKSFVETMRDWQSTLVDDVHALAKKLPDDVCSNLGLFTHCISHSLPNFSSLCEGVSRHNRHAYTELSELIGLGVRIHAYGIIRQRGDKVDMMRYGRALHVVSELLKCPEPRNADVPLPPLHVDEGTHLAHSLSDSMSDISLILFRQMRKDNLNDNVDFLLERTAHILAEGTRYTEDARRGMKNAFEGVYRQMTPQEKQAISNSRFYAMCESSRSTIYQMMRDVDLEDVRGARWGLHLR